MSQPARKILVVFEHRGPMESMRASIKHHLYGLEAGEGGHEFAYYNSAEDVSGWIIPDGDGVMPERLRDQKFDAVVLHNTFLCMRWTGEYFPRWRRRFEWIGAMPCLKVAVPQDEYDHSRVLDEWMLDWGVSVVISNFTGEKQKLLHPLLHGKAVFRHCLTGYIDDTSAKQYASRCLPVEQRPLDVVYRGRQLPYWFGSAGQLKHVLAEKIAPRAVALGFRTDVSTRNEDAIVGDAWLDFLASSKSVIGSEGGASAIDWRGELRAQIQAFLAEKPDLTFDELSALMPEGWDSIRFQTITPRHFEAAITRTAQILVEGHYDGFLEAERHFIPMAADWSDIDRALSRLNDTKLVNDVIQRTYDEIYLSGNCSYRAYAARVLDGIEEGLKNFGPPTPLRKPMPDAMTTAEPPAPAKAEEKHEAVMVLERQLVAERQRNTLLAAQLNEARAGGQTQLERVLRTAVATVGSKKRFAVVTAAVVGFVLVANAVLAAMVSWWITGSGNSG